MFIDSSAFVAILCEEPDYATLLARIDDAAQCYTSPLVRLETCMVSSTRLDLLPDEINSAFGKLLLELDIKVIALTDEIGEIAIDAFQRYGKGRGNRAKLNLADCMSYACAKAHNVPILFKGRDFAHTDLVRA